MARADAPDALLVACGMAQILDDYVTRDVLSLARVAEVAPRRLASVVLAARKVLLLLRDRAPAERRARALRRRHADVVRACATALAGNGVLPGPAPRTSLAAVRERVQRLPNCFCSFDQHPDDCAALAARVAKRLPDRTAPLAVLGIRTSGSYLAPIVAAHLRAAGYTSVGETTHRPARRLLREDAARLRAARTVLIVDDPPRTGNAYVRTAEALEHLGVPGSAQILLVPLLGEGLPDALAGRDAVTLPSHEWAIRTRVRDGESRRGHVRARSEDGRELLRGVGFGYFGRRAETIAERLPEFLPRVTGLEEGLLRREWLEDESRVGRANERLAQFVAVYLRARAERLGVTHDPTPALSGDDVAWERLGALLGGCFGRMRLLVRPFARNVARALCAPASPTVPDGHMRVESFFDLGERGLRKVSFEESTNVTSGRAAFCFDPAFDAAGVVADAEIENVADGTFADDVRRACTDALGAISDERWLLYQLVHHGIARYVGRGSLERLLAVERATSRAVQRYFAPLIGVHTGDGALCAVDIDDVLETRLLDAPAIGPDGAIALAGLARRHRVVLASGRSLPELAERCRAWGLAGGTAAYGAVVFDARSGTSRS
ncbi:MAG: hypothetical protein JOY72_09155, partial [Actinobacteria bacterium]|nr:hypothetical protein [Actinomycetota bacterium]